MFDLREFMKALAVYREGVPRGDVQSDPSMNSLFNVTVGGMPYIADMALVACDAHGEPVSALVGMLSPVPLTPTDVRYAVVNRHFLTDTTPCIWEPEQKVYFSDPSATPDVAWVLRKL